jgi:hypothetical protein
MTLHWQLTFNQFLPDIRNGLLFDIVNEEFCLYKLHPVQLLKLRKSKKAQILHLRASV